VDAAPVFIVFEDLPSGLGLALPGLVFGGLMALGQQIHNLARALSAQQTQTHTRSGGATFWSNVTRDSTWTENGTLSLLLLQVLSNNRYYPLGFVKEVNFGYWVAVYCRKLGILGEVSEVIHPTNSEGRELRKTNHV
jgi:hypothetical protein